jgi:hypothetical protein
MARADHAQAGLTVRCAIYTRKSLSRDRDEKDFASPVRSSPDSTDDLMLELFAELTGIRS